MFKAVTSFGSKFYYVNVIILYERERKMRGRERENDRLRGIFFSLNVFSTVSSGGIAVMATNILSNAVFHIIDENIVNHYICVRYLKAKSKVLFLVSVK